MAIERVLLQTIRFDLHVDHPYEILLKYAKVIKGDKEKVQKLVQMAWTFINDRYSGLVINSFIAVIYTWNPVL